MDSNAKRNASPRWRRLADGRPSGGFTPEATVAARHATTPKPTTLYTTASFASIRAALSGRSSLLLPLREEFVGLLLSLFVTKLLHLLVDPPLVAERIDEHSVTSSPEHVLHGHAHARAGSHRALDNSVRIVRRSASAIITLLRGCALRRCDAAALTDGRRSGAFTPEATGAARRASTLELLVYPTSRPSTKCVLDGQLTWTDFTGSIAARASQRIREVKAFTSEFRIP